MLVRQCLRKYDTSSKTNPQEKQDGHIYEPSLVKHTARVSFSVVKRLFLKRGCKKADEYT